MHTTGFGTAETRLAPFARLPRCYAGSRVVHSTVDADGRAHWLLTVGTADPSGTGPYDAVVVTVDGGDVSETHLSAVLPWGRRLEALPDGGFVVAAGRARPDEGHVQLFDALGRCRRTFRLGDGIAHLLADEVGDLWVGYFDEGVYGDDALSASGLRRFSSSGEPLWAYRPVADSGWISDCYALNVTGRTAWACPYTDFPLLEIRAGDGVRVWKNPVHGAAGLAVCGDRVAFLGGYRERHGLLTECRLTETAVEVVAERLLLRPDGGALARRRSVVSRGPRLYVRERNAAQWSVLDIG